MGQDRIGTEKQISQIFPAHLREFVYQAFEQPDRPEEFRLRIGQPLMLLAGRKEFFWEDSRKKLGRAREGAYHVTQKDLQEVVSYMSNFSLYAFEEELRAGFLTIQGGHRIGIGGKAVCEDGRIQTIRQISFLNIRIAGQRKGCADGVMPFLRREGGIYNTLILSPPGVGKTTLLRDCIRQLSDGTKKYPGLKVGVVDERSELAACYLGVPQNDLGIRTDVLDSCPKAEGMRLLLRSMSPQAIAVDELGGQADYQAVGEALHCGCRILGTMHGESVEELNARPWMQEWLRQGYFERYLFLRMAGDTERQIAIYDKSLQSMGILRLCQ